MTNHVPVAKELILSTQSFLVLCQLFDGCYDELKKHQELEETVEAIAQSLLHGVTHLQEQNSPPKQMTLSLEFHQLFLLRKLLTGMMTNFPADVTQPKTREWLYECLQALEHATLP